MSTRCNFLKTALASAAGLLVGSLSSAPATVITEVDTDAELVARLFAAPEQVKFRIDVELVEQLAAEMRREIDLKIIREWSETRLV